MRLIAKVKRQFSKLIIVITDFVISWEREIHVSHDAISQQGSYLKDHKGIWNSFSYLFQRRLFTVCGNPNEVNSTNNLLQLSLRFICQHDFNNFNKLSLLIFKKAGLTPMLANHKKGIFLLKRAFLFESQWVVRRLSNQISSFRRETRESFLIYVQLTFMLHYRIYGFLLTDS